MTSFMKFLKCQNNQIKQLHKKHQVFEDPISKSCT